MPMRDTNMPKGVLPRKTKIGFDTSEFFILGQPVKVKTAKQSKNSRRQARAIAAVAKFPMVLVLGNFL